MPDRFKPSPRVFFSCLLLSQIFALVYPLGNLTVESQDRKRSIHYFKYPSIDFGSYPTQTEFKTRVSKRHVPNRILTESPSRFRVSRISESLLLTPNFVVLVSRVTRSLLHNIHYLTLRQGTKLIRHTNEGK